jgi:hypothetical protein
MGAGGATPSPFEFVGLIRDAGVIGILAVIVIGALREWWVSGVQYRRVLNERDELQMELLRVLGLTDRATRMLDRATTRLSGHESRLSRLQAERDVRDRREPDD